ncbi:hypothetical protein PMAYCL1PPCAC_23477, partial [Pristionchus mayeri]
RLRPHFRLVCTMQWNRGRCQFIRDTNHTLVSESRVDLSEGHEGEITLPSHHSFFLLLQSLLGRVFNLALFFLFSLFLLSLAFLLLSLCFFLFLLLFSFLLFFFLFLFLFILLLLFFLFFLLL